MTEQFLESLEQRIAPATLINPKTVQFHDAEGDLIQVSISKGEFSESDFTFDTGTFAGDGPQTLESLHLGTAFADANLTVKVLMAGSGEGSNKAQIGGIVATGVNLGKVSIAGDLGFIDAGAGTSKAAIKGLSVESLGKLNPVDFGQDNRTSDIFGSLSSLTIAGDFGGTLNVTGGGTATIGKISIGGSMISGAGDIAGYIHATGAIKSVKVGGSIDGSDADTANEAGIVSDLGINSVSVGGSIEGGGFKNTGVIIAGLTNVATGTILSGTTKISSVTVGGDVVGGAGQYSGAIIGWAGLGTVTVKGNLTGGTGEDSGTIQGGGIITGVPAPNPDPTKPQTKDVIIGGSVAKVTIGHEVTGNDGKRSASILSWGTTVENVGVIGGILGQVSVGGSITGGDGVFSALVYGNAGLNKVTVGLDLIGGEGDDSGRIATDNGPLGPISIGGDVKGGAGAESGMIFAGDGGAGFPGNISSVFIGGDLIGGGDVGAGSIWADGSVGNVTVKGEVMGGTAARTGSIIIFGSAKTISVAESVTGTDYNYTGYIQAQAGVSKIAIGGDLIGGNSPEGSGATTVTRYTGAIAVGGITSDGFIAYGSAKTISIKGSIIAGEIESGLLQDSGAIRVNGALGTLNVGGSLVGNEDMSVVITGLVNPFESVEKNTALKTIKIGQNVDYAQIVAGYISYNGGNTFYEAAPFARIGSVKVGGNWTASSVAAGVIPGENGYGEGDAEMDNYYSQQFPEYGLSKITSIVIGGTVAGGAEGDQYGFAAQSFGKISVNGVNQQIPAVDSTSNVTEDGSVKIHTVEKLPPPTPPTPPTGSGTESEA